MGPDAAARPKSAPRSYGKRGHKVQRLAAVFAIAGLVLLWMAGSLSAAERTIKVVAFGDSLTAGYQLPASAAFPVQLELALKAKGIAADIVNAGVSGDTASGGLARLDWSVPAGTDAVILELGANDMLRGIDPKVTRAAIDGILRRLNERGTVVLLCGMLSPPNMGPDYAAAFDAVFPDLAKSYDVALYPFFLDGVAAERTLNQPDGLHPTAAGVDRIVARILPQVEALVARVNQRRNP
jgi:acyl-CoA thioesterase-1